MPDTLASRKDDSGSRPTLRTPPEGVEAGAPTPRVSAALRRDIIIDSACERLFHRHFGQRTDWYRAITMDVASQVATGDMAPLARASAVIFGPQTLLGRPTAEVVEQLRALEPHVGIYVIATHLDEVARMMTVLAAGGVDEVFPLATRSDEQHLERTLRMRLLAPAPEIEIRLLWKWFRESPERSLVMHCIRNGFRLDDWSVRASVFTACRKTLQNRVSALGLPSPGMIARCGRVLHAQELERRGVRPTALIAEILGFPSASAMQRARRRVRKSLMSRGRQSLVFASLLR